MNNLYIVCVLYNQSINNIKSLPQFIELKKKYKTVDIIIIDNSNHDYMLNNVKEYNQYYKEKIEYISNNGQNLGLSKSFNEAIRTFSKSDYYMMTVDDDTYFSPKYLDNIMQEVIHDQYAILSGIVTHQQGNMSPLRKFKIINSAFITEPGLYDNIFCINSGLTIRKSIVDKIGLYDERLFLDMVDYWLMYTLMKYDLNHILIVDGEIKQDFSGSSYPGKQSLIKRYEIYKEDCLKFIKITHKNKVRIRIILFIRWLRIQFLIFKHHGD